MAEKPTKYGAKYAKKIGYKIKIQKANYQRKGKGSLWNVVGFPDGGIH